MDNDGGLALEVLFFFLFSPEGQRTDQSREHYVEGRFPLAAKINFNVPFTSAAGRRQGPNMKCPPERFHSFQPHGVLGLSLQSGEEEREISEKSLSGVFPQPDSNRLTAATTSFASKTTFGVNLGAV